MLAARAWRTVSRILSSMAASRAAEMGLASGGHRGGGDSKDLGQHVVVVDAGCDDHLGGSIGGPSGGVILGRDKDRLLRPRTVNPNRVFRQQKRVDLVDLAQLHRPHFGH